MRNELPARFFFFTHLRKHLFLILRKNEYICQSTKKIMTLFNQLLIAMPGTPEMLLIVLAILVLFGGKKIPEFMRGLGKGMREFKDAKDNIKSELESGMKEKE
jgi:sec-independent protein translocase protein TatA